MHESLSCIVKKKKNNHLVFIHIKTIIVGLYMRYVTFSSNHCRRSEALEIIRHQATRTE